MRKLISRLFQIAAVLLMVLVVLTLPFTLTMRNLGRVVFHREAVLGLANENLLNAELLAAVGQQAVQEALRTPEAEPQNEEGAAVNRVMLAALNNLTRAEWTRLMQIIAPQEVVSGLTETTIHAFYDWLEDDEALLPELTLNLGPWKTGISQNALPMMEMLLNALPPCDSAGIRAYQSEEAALEAAESLPACRPPEPTYSEMLNVGATVLPDRLAQTPDEISITSGLLPQQGAELARLKQDLQDLRDLMQGAWLLPVFLFLLALPMGARTPAGALRWAGWPLLLCGMSLVALSMGLLIFTEGLLNGLFEQGALSDLPRTVTASLRASGAAFVSLVAVPTLRQGLLLGGLSILLLAVAAYLHRRSLERALAAASGVMPAMPAPPPVSTVQTAPPATPAPAPEPDPTEEDDDSKPTGMFG